jgi:ABC-type branched-subunit amino acid transport system substrate-binding protein
MKRRATLLNNPKRQGAAALQDARATLVLARIRLSLSLLSLLASLSLSAAENIKIGLLAPPQEPELASLKQAAALAIEDANRAPGTQCELVIRGSPGQWGTDGDEAVVLALDEGSRAMIAPPDGAASHQVLQVAGRTRIPVVTICSDSSVTGSGIPWVLRVAPRTELEAQTIFTNHPQKTWAALVPDGRAGREATKDLRTAATNSGCNLKEIVTLPPQKSEWPVALKTLLANRSDAILLWLDASRAGEMAQQLRKSGYTGMLAGPSRLNSSLFLTNANSAAEAFIVPGIAVDKSFVQKYHQRFGGGPDFTAIMAYDAASLLAQLLRDAGDKPPYRAFPLTKQYTGASGPLTFDKDGNRQLSLRLFTCRNGEFIPLQ